MKKIVFIGYSLVQKEIYGIQRNTYEILKELDKLITNQQVEVLIPANGSRKPEFENIKVVELGSLPKSSDRNVGRVYKLIWKNLLFPRYVKMSGAVSVDMLHIFPRRVCEATMIYDCIPDLFPQFYSSFSGRLYRLIMRKNQQRAAKRSQIILTDSNCAKEDISRLYNTDKDKIAVIPCAWQHFERIEEDEKILDKFSLKDKEYFFSLGRHFEHKNEKWIIAAARQNPSERFVVTGSYFSSPSDAEKSAPDNVIFSGYLTDGEVKALMKHCKAFIQPSLYEGFGIPPMEAMSVGADCIVSNVSSLPEVYGNSVRYIDPTDYGSIDLEKIMSVGKEDNSAVLNKYSWAKSAEMLFEIVKNQAKE